MGLRAKSLQSSAVAAGRYVGLRTGGDLHIGLPDEFIPAIFRPLFRISVIPVARSPMNTIPYS